MSEHIIGYIAVDDNGQPYQPTLRQGYHARKKSITVYKYEKYAKSFTGYSVPVYVKDVNE